MGALQKLLPDSAGFQHPDGSAGLTGAGHSVQGAAGDGTGSSGHGGSLPLPGERPNKLTRNHKESSKQSSLILAAVTICRLLW